MGTGMDIAADMMPEVALLRRGRYKCRPFFIEESVQQQDSKA